MICQKLPILCTNQYVWIEIEYYGNSGIARQLYLKTIEDRSFTSSYYECINTSVPKGSVLVPVFLAINDLCKWTNIFDLFVYADDITII